jgi:hypothetical protein
MNQDVNILIHGKVYFLYHCVNTGQGAKIICQTVSRKTFKSKKNFELSLGNVSKKFDVEKCFLSGKGNSATVTFLTNLHILRYNLKTR